MHLGEVIKKYRHDHGKMSMQAFADKCGLSKGYIAMLERNKNSKTGDPVIPSVETFMKVAKAMNMTLNDLADIVDENQPVALTSNDFPKGTMLYHTIVDNNLDTLKSHIWGDDDTPSLTDSVTSAVRIPVLGSVPAGIPLEAIEDIVDWEDIPREWTKGGKEFFGLKIQGDSMYPKYMEGDTIILRKADDCESGDECVVYVNGYDATFKKVIKKTDHIILQPLNSAYEPMMIDYNDEINPIKIVGVVVELRRKL